VDPINKYDLLKLIAEQYEVDTPIEPYDAVSIDRSLDSTRFREATGYRPHSWPELCRTMRQDYLECGRYPEGKERK